MKVDSSYLTMYFSVYYYYKKHNIIILIPTYIKIYYN